MRKKKKNHLVNYVKEMEESILSNSESEKEMTPQQQPIKGIVVARVDENGDVMNKEKGEAPKQEEINSSDSESEDERRRREERKKMKKLKRKEEREKEKEREKEQEEREREKEKEREREREKEREREREKEREREREKEKEREREKEKEREREKEKEKEKEAEQRRKNHRKKVSIYSELEDSEKKFILRAIYDKLNLKETPIYMDDIAVQYEMEDNIEMHLKMICKMIIRMRNN